MNPRDHILAPNPHADAFDELVEILRARLKSAPPDLDVLEEALLDGLGVPLRIRPLLKEHATVCFYGYTRQLVLEAHRVARTRTSPKRPPEEGNTHVQNVRSSQQTADAKIEAERSAPKIPRPRRPKAKP